MVTSAPALVLAQDAPTRKQAPAEPQPVPAPVNSAPAPGELTVESLGALLQALGLKPKRSETRYDFAFAAKQEDEEWTLSMSAVLSTDNKSIWVMAWLDELPKADRDIPRSALLHLLAENDRMGKGRFFSYIESNRRFALQQVLENHEITSKKFRTVLVELGQTVALTYPQWSVAAWKEGGSPGSTGAPATEEANAGQPVNAATPTSGPQRGSATARPATTTVSGKPRTSTTR
jgi:hypothetical protein